MKTYSIKSNSVGHFVVDETGEHHGIYGSESEAQNKISELQKSEKPKPPKVVEHKSPPKPVVKLKTHPRVIPKRKKR